jgi:tRNA(Leu) C34 or U34 (ribose-2'-O)-methylase TrmL
MGFNIVLLHPNSRENVASVIRTGQNFNLNTLFIIGGVIKDTYKGNIHKFSHQMDTQDGVNNITLMYFETLTKFLEHLPSQTTLVIVEILDNAKNLPNFIHPLNATYMFGREKSGIQKHEIEQIKDFFINLNKDIPKEYLNNHKKTAHLDFIKLDTPKSLNLGICNAIIMYDRYYKNLNNNLIK